jgi:GMP synthase (glutamine-hydrolysing)
MCSISFLNISIGVFLTRCFFTMVSISNRYKERERVVETFERDLHLPVTCVDATDQFLSKLKGVVDPEIKRKIIGKEFTSIFDALGQELEQKLGKKPSYLVQGTLYPDVIESCPPPGSGRTHSHTIKSHHNVGGLPKDMKLKLIEPLKLLFKDEVSISTFLVACAYSSVFVVL